MFGLEILNDILSRSLDTAISIPQETDRKRLESPTLHKNMEMNSSRKLKLDHFFTLKEFFPS